MDLNNHVILPHDDFVELQEAAMIQPTLQERASSVAQVMIVTYGIAAAVTLGRWLWVKATDWQADRQYQRDLDLIHGRAHSAQAKK